MENQKSTAATVFTNGKHVDPSPDLSKSAIANRLINMQRMQNVLLVWLDNIIDEDNVDCNIMIKQLKRVINNLNIFTDSDKCAEFIQTITNNRICMIISGSLGKQIVPRVHDMSQVDIIFIFCNNQKWHEHWAKDWPKVKGVFTDITPVCEALTQAAHQSERNATSISFVAPNKKLDQLDPSFMYTQILKEILLTINFESKHIKEYIHYCRDAFAGNGYELHNMKRMERHYQDRKPVWWYTYECFLYPMLNRALKVIDVDIIIRMGFFISDLHRDIQRLHSEQYNNQAPSKIFTVYRGQGLSKEDFIEMTQTKGGLLSFNNFLSTSKIRNVSLNFAQKASTNPDLIGVLFVMQINTSYQTTPFASVSNVSCFHTKGEVLFSMHTIFRIGDIKPIDGNKQLYQVNLILANNNDEDLRNLTNRIRQETFPNSKGWSRLGLLLIKMGHFKQAHGVCEGLLNETTNESEKANVYLQLGLIKYNEGQYQEALSYYEKSLAIYQKTLPPNHINLATSYTGIGSAYESMGDYPKALAAHEKALTIRQHSLPSNHLDLAASCKNIGNVYHSMGDYPKSLSYYEKSLAIYQKTLPPHHINLVTSYMGIGNAHYSMNDYPKALAAHEKALEIQQRALPPNHPDLDTSYNKIGMVYYSMADYPKALSYFEKELAIKQQSLPPNHPDLASSYMGIGNVHYNMDDYPKALSYYEKDLEIKLQSLPLNHIDLASSFKNIGNVYYSMGDYQKALYYYEKDLEIKQQALSPNHPDLALSYMGIGNVYSKMGDYPKALTYYEKPLANQQQSLPFNHPDLASFYMGIGNAYYSMEDYSKALASHEKALAIQQRLLSANHPDIGASFNNIGMVYHNMGDYPKALTHYKKALAIQQKSLPAHHADLAASFNNIGNVYENMGSYLKALPHYKRAVHIGRQALAKDHPHLELFIKNLKEIKAKL
ncbi:unnamed protein product [Adineta steineri]|uniref:Uncharacterized protein n=1 Tax=Adineta steineri TaxID=433720 RepID=A0A818Y232_9BILA|nr:unnamed protein product [Adineta steineri]CAF3746958.1 unnamed protein product [Adineta steineri]